MTQGHNASLALLMMNVGRIADRAECLLYQLKRTAGFEADTALVQHELRPHRRIYAHQRTSNGCHTCAANHGRDM